jgi:hypothetical protein
MPISREDYVRGCHEWLVWWDTPAAARPAHPSHEFDFNRESCDYGADVLSEEDQRRLSRFFQRMLPMFNKRMLLMGVIQTATVLENGATVRFAMENRWEDDYSALEVLAGRIISLEDLLELELIDAKYTPDYFRLCHAWLIYWGTPDHVRMKNGNKPQETGDDIPQWLRRSIKLADFPQVDRVLLTEFYKVVLHDFRSRRDKDGYTVHDTKVDPDNGAQVQVILDTPLEAKTVTHDPLAVLSGQAIPFGDVENAVFIAYYHRRMHKYVYAELAHQWLEWWALQTFNEKTPTKAFGHEIASSFVSNPMAHPPPSPDREDIEIDEHTGGYTQPPMRIRRRQLAKGATLAPGAVEAAKQFWNLMREILQGAITEPETITLRDEDGEEREEIECSYRILRIEEVNAGLTRAKMLVRALKKTPGNEILVDVDLLEVISGGLIYRNLLESRTLDFIKFGRDNANNISVFDGRDAYGYAEEQAPRLHREFMKLMKKRYGPVLGDLVDFVDSEEGAYWSEAADFEWPGESVYTNPALLDRVVDGYKRSLFRRAQKFDKTVAELPEPVENAIFAFADLASEERKKQEANREQQALEASGYKIETDKNGNKVYVPDQALLARFKQFTTADAAAPEATTHNNDDSDTANVEVALPGRGKTKKKQKRLPEKRRADETESRAVVLAPPPAARSKQRR